jgi:Flp pilus assembly pilin Flp
MSKSIFSKFWILKSLKDYKDHKGQTSVEYILMLAVVMVLIINILGSVRDRLMSSQTPCPPNDDSLGCTISRSVASFGTSGDNFRFFRLRR